MYKQHCNIGIVGRGFVGSAVEYGFSDKRKYLLLEAQGEWALIW